MTALAARLALIGMALIAAACAPRDEQRQLNEAAAMLDANSVDDHRVAGHESSPHD